MFFSIGITTYDRFDMLKDTISSVIQQSFSDYEIIVSNDNPQRELSRELLGFNDERLRIINQPKNLGEFQNMKYLLGISKGKYFTWLADDDLYSREFLQEAFDVILKYDYPTCLFTSYKIIYDRGCPSLIEKIRKREKLYKGHEFLNLYLRKKIKAIGVMGIFNVDYLRQAGNLEDISNDGMGLYCEYMHVFKAALLDRIAYIDEPLIYYRAHEKSWGCANIDIKQYDRAGKNLINKAIDIFQLPKFKRNFYSNFYGILRLCMGNYIGIKRKINDLSFIEFLRYLYNAKEYIKPLKKTKLYWIAICSLLKVELRLIFTTGWYKLRMFIFKI